MTPHHRALLVDLDGTLYAPLPVKLAMGFELTLFGRRDLAAIKAFRREHERLRRELEEPVESPFDLQLENVAGALGVPVEELRGTVRNWMQERPGRWIRLFRRRGLLREIAEFRSGGGLAALVTDYPARLKLEALGAADLFDEIVANGEPGGPVRMKPRPDGFLLAAERLGVAPEHCLVIGDRRDADEKAALAAGMAYRHMG